MMGYGFYVNGRSSTASSNLSALAPPFTVDRSAPKPRSSPLVDLSEPTTYALALNPSFNDWVNSNPPISSPDYFCVHPNPELDSVPSSSLYQYPASTPYVPPLDSTDPLYHQDSKCVSEAKPPFYYASYVSPSIGDDAIVVPKQSSYHLLSTSHVAPSNGPIYDDYPQSFSGLGHAAPWGGLWEGVADWRQNTQQVQHDGNFSSEENSANQGFYLSKGTSRCEEAPHIIDVVSREKYAKCASGEQLNHISLLGENSKFISADDPTMSTSASTLVIPDICSQIPFKCTINSKNEQIPHNSQDGKCLRNHDDHDANPDDSTSAMKSTPIIIIGSPSEGVNNELSVVRKPHLFVSSECQKVRFDARQLSCHLGQNDPVITEFSWTNNDMRPSKGGVSGDVFDSLYSDRAGMQTPQVTTAHLNLAVDKDKTFSAAGNCSESLDYYNPVVDSPCWKGASLSHLSPFEVSDSASQMNTKEVESCNGSDLQRPQVSSMTAKDAVKVYPEKPSDNLALQNNRRLETFLTSSMNRPLDADVSFVGARDTLKLVSCPTKPTYCKGVQSNDNTNGPKMENALSTDKSDLKTPWIMQPSLEEDNSLSEKDCAPGIGVVDVGANVNDNCYDCSSYVPFHTAEHVLCSLSPVGDAPSKFIRESRQKVDTPTILSTMHNLSKSLLFHCLNDACELEEVDFETVKDIINNLEMCATKNAKAVSSTRKSLIPQSATSQFLVKSPKLHKVTNMNSPWVSDVNSVTEDLFKCQNGQEELNILSSERYKKSNLNSCRDAADLVKADNLTQGIKKVLAENFQSEDDTQPEIFFYKNLWLDAEASLCSLNAMARFNQMKIKMDKCDSQKLNEKTMVMENQSSSKIFSDSCAINRLAAETNGRLTTNVMTSGSPSFVADSSASVMARYHILRSRVDNDNSVNASSVEKSRSNTYSDLNKLDKLAHEDRDSANNICIQDSVISSATGHANDLMSRFHILKSQVDYSNSIGSSAIQESNSEFSADLSEVDKLSSEVKGSTLPDMSIQDFTLPSTANHSNNIEASVMARFHILKHRVENSSSKTTEEEESEGIHFEQTGLRKHAKSVIQNYSADTTKDKSTVKEFNLFVKDDHMTQSFVTGRLGDQLHAGWNDSISSSDWEHVLKEELGGQS